MLTWPDTMHKAQAELDEVVGRHRLPTFKDKEKLPYVRAMVNEVLRWRPAAPLGAFVNYFASSHYLTQTFYPSCSCP